MNSVYKVVGAVFTSILLSSSSLAEETNTQECGEIRFVHDVSKPSVFRIVTINGYSIENKFRLDARENRLTVPVGEHSFYVAEEPQQLYATVPWGGASQIRNYYENNKQDASLFSQVKNHFLSANIEANKAYVFSLASDKKNLKLKKIVEKTCNKTKQEPVVGTNYLQLDPKQLSELQLSKLYNLSGIIERSKKDRGTSGAYFPLSFLTYFGVVVDDEYDGTAIKVLSVQPMSSAFKLGLRSGDKIIRFQKVAAKQKHLTPVQVLEQYIGRVQYYGELRFLVKRNGKKKDIRGKFEPTIVPEAWVKIDKEKIAISSEEQIFERHEQLFYGEFFRELIEEHAKDFENNDRLSIRLESNTVYKLGLRGGLQELGIMELSYVDPYSVFAKLGVKKGDQIVSFGKEKRKPITLVAFTEYFNTLRSDEDFYLEIVRDNVAKSIVAAYEPITYPAIELVVDLKSVRNAEETTLIAYKNYKKDLKRMRQIRSSSTAFYRHKMNPIYSRHYTNKRYMDRIENQ